jgi:hypothetical protein
MIKFAGLTDSIASILDKIEEGELMNDIPNKVGPERDAAIAKAIASVEKGEEVIKFWVNATQMRRWLS